MRTVDSWQSMNSQGLESSPDHSGRNIGMFLDRDDSPLSSSPRTGSGTPKASSRTSSPCAPFFQKDVAPDADESVAAAPAAIAAAPARSRAAWLAALACAAEAVVAAPALDDAWRGLALRAVGALWLAALWGLATGR